MRSLIRLNAILASLVLVAGCDDGKPSASAKHTRQTSGKTTQKVLKLEDALKDGGVLVDPKITNTDPLSQLTEAQKFIGAQGAQMAVTQKIGIRNALNAMEDPKPRTYEQFMAEIVEPGKPDGLNFQMPPFYQEYAWDEANQKIVVVEFPAKKEAFKKDQDKEFGRN